MHVGGGGGGEGESSRPMNCSIHALLQLRVAYIQDKTLCYKISSRHEFSAKKLIVLE